MDDIVERLVNGNLVVTGSVEGVDELLALHKEAADEIEALRAATQWRDISTAPKDGTKIFAWTLEGTSIAWFENEDPDGPDSMGHDAGWMDSTFYMFPGRSFGNPEYFRDAVDQPTHWMPLPTPPESGQ